MSELDSGITLLVTKKMKKIVLKATIMQMVINILISMQFSLSHSEATNTEAQVLSAVEDGSTNQMMDSGANDDSATSGTENPTLHSDKIKSTTEPSGSAEETETADEEHHEKASYDIWPAGDYGIPQEISGCPNHSSWYSGSRYHATRPKNSMNSHSPQYHLAGKVTLDGVEQMFCIKSAFTSETSETSGTMHIWKPGKYCIYKYKHCPMGFTEGSYTWDGSKDGGNLESGAVPDGEYTNTRTTIKFCCRTDGDPSSPIKLPSTSPFYLFPYGSTKCQSVENMNSRLEWVFFDDNDRENTNTAQGTIPYGPRVNSTYNTILHFCYYIPSSGKNKTLNYGINFGIDSKSHLDSNMVTLGPIAGALIFLATAFMAYKGTPLGDILKKYASSLSAPAPLAPAAEAEASANRSTTQVEQQQTVPPQAQMQEAVQERETTGKNVS